MKGSVSGGEGVMLERVAVRRWSRMGRVEGVGREERRDVMEGSSWFMTAMMDMRGR